MTRLYGLFADLRARPVLVVGGGPVAERKVAALLEAGAAVTVGAPSLTAQLAAWRLTGRVRHAAGDFAEAWLQGCWLVVAATDAPALNRRIAAAAGARRLFVNVVDDAELSSFHVPAIVDRGALQIAISTAGAAPALASWLRGEVERWLEPSLGALVALAALFRERIKSRFPQLAQRRRFYAGLPLGVVAARLRCQDAAGAQAALLAQLEAPAAPAAGRVVLVGAGPGDPGLLTLHGLRALQAADVVVHDRLASSEVLALARRDAQRIDVGKAPGHHRLEQSGINALLVQLARSGHRVVRLKGGDPFIFGRGGEELECLRAHGIPYEVVPGITAASGCAAYAGVPLTHREHAQSVRFVTAQGQQSMAALDWAALAPGRQTLAVYMGVGQLAPLTAALLAHGRAPDTPFALIENGTRPQQRVLTGALARLSELAAEHRVAAPALLVVGEVAALAPRLGWYGAPPVTAELVEGVALDPRRVEAGAEALDCS